MEMFSVKLARLLNLCAMMIIKFVYYGGMHRVARASLHRDDANCINFIIITASVHLYYFCRVRSNVCPSLDK